MNWNFIQFVYTRSQRTNAMRTAKLINPFFVQFIQSRIFCPQLSFQWLIQPEVESRFVVRSQLGPSSQSNSSFCNWLQVVTPFEGLLPPTGIEPTPFQNSTCKVAGLQVYDATMPPIHVARLFLDPIKNPENLWLSDLFREYRKRPVV